MNFLLVSKLIYFTALFKFQENEKQLSACLELANLIKILLLNKI